MARVIIFGCGQIAEVIWHYLTHESAHQVVAFTVDDAFRDKDQLFGLPVVAFENVEQLYPPSDHSVFIAIGYGQRNLARTRKLAEARAKGYEAIGHISPRAAAPPGFVPRPNTFIMEHNTVQPFVEIGENVIVWSGNHLGHHSRIGDNVFIASHVVISGNVAVGDNTFIGVNATLRDNITLGAACIVGAGALVLADAPDRAVFPGAATQPLGRKGAAA